MATQEKGAIDTDEHWFGVLDVLLLLGLLAAALFHYERRKRDEARRSYSLQPSTPINQTDTEKSFLKKMKASGRNIVAFYGSQTGTAEEFAGRLAKEGLRYSLKGMVADPEEYYMEELVNLKDIPKSMAVFCLATYGEGDPTDNAMEFFEWLQAGDSDLTGLNYSVFGLGNKTYEHYNQVAKYVDKRLEELGGTRVYQLGLGDDDVNIEDDFITWKAGFWPAVCEYFDIEALETLEDESVRQYRLQEFAHTDPAIFTGEIARLHSFSVQRPPFNVKNPFLATVEVNRELHTGGGRSCMHIEMNIEGSKIRYDAGDHVAVYPTNDAELVNKLGELLNADLDTVITLTNTDEDSSKKHPFPCPTSYRTALTNYLDITSNPRTHILKELVNYTSDVKEKDQLRLMVTTSLEGKALYQKWIIADNRNIVQILEDLKSCQPPIDHLCELLPRLQCRYYSISSSPRVHPERIHITAVLVKYTTPTGRENKGVATSWLSHKLPGPGVTQKVPVFVRKSQFRLPSRTQTPIIMIGPGTGIAPFRGFIQERDHCLAEGKNVGDTILYFGCRKQSDDYIYADELQDYVKKGSLKLHVAFSRDQEKKVYVTHLLKDNADEIWKVIGRDLGHVYVCGDARNMARDVHNIILEVVRQKGNMSESQAIAYVKKMEAQKRYSADVWS